MFCPEHPKWDPNLKFTPPSETTSISTPFIYGVPPPPPWGAKRFLYIFTAINWSVSPFRSFYRQKWQISLPFHILQVAKSLPFCIPEAWRRYPFRAEPLHTGNYREHPPLPPPLPECLKQIKQHIELATQTSLITLCYKSDFLPVFSYNFVNRDQEW